MIFLGGKPFNEWNLRILHIRKLTDFWSLRTFCNWSKSLVETQATKSARTLCSPIYQSDFMKLRLFVEVMAQPLGMYQKNVSGR